MIHVGKYWVKWIKFSERNKWKWSSSRGWCIFWLSLQTRLDTTLPMMQHNNTYHYKAVLESYSSKSVEFPCELGSSFSLLAQCNLRLFNFTSLSEVCRSERLKTILNLWTEESDEVGTLTFYDSYQWFNLTKHHFMVFKGFLVRDSLSWQLLHYTK